MFNGFYLNRKLSLGTVTNVKLTTESLRSWPGDPEAGL